MKNDIPIITPNTTYSAVTSQNTNKKQQIIENNMEIESKSTTENNSPNMQNKSSTYKTVTSSIPSLPIEKQKTLTTTTQSHTISANLKNSFNFLNEIGTTINNKNETAGNTKQKINVMYEGTTSEEE